MLVTILIAIASIAAFPQSTQTNATTHPSNTVKAHTKGNKTESAPTNTTATATSKRILQGNQGQTQLGQQQYQPQGQQGYSSEQYQPRRQYQSDQGQIQQGPRQGYFDPERQYQPRVGYERGSIIVIQCAPQGNGTGGNTTGIGKED
jgi:hypothetical protein